MQALGRGHGRRSSYPELPGEVKGATVQAFTVFLAHVLQALPAEGEHAEVRVCCAWGAAEFVDVMSTAPLVMSDEDTARAQTALRSYLDCYATLAVAAARDSIYMWKFRPKTHYLEHLLEFLQSSKLNPGKLATWDDESFLSKVKMIVGKCSGRTALRTSLKRYVVFLALRWQPRA